MKKLPPPGKTPDQGRDERGRWLPGVSGNPSGRPKGLRGLAEEIRRSTADGLELVATFLSIVRDPNQPAALRCAAARELLDRAFGRAPSSDPAPDSDPEALAPEEKFVLLLTDEKMWFRLRDAWLRQRAQRMRKRREFGGAALPPEVPGDQEDNGAS